MQPEDADYSFLTESNQGSKRSMIPGGASKNKRIVIVVLGAAFLITGFAMVMSLVLGGGTDLKQLRLKVAQQHTELIRVAEIGVEKARSPQASNLASTTKLSFKSTETDVVGLAQKDQKVNNKLLEAGQDPKTDERLTTAEQNNRFDEVFLDVINGLLANYRKDLDTLFKASKSKSEKEILTDVYTQVEALIQTPAEPQAENSGN